MKLVAQKGSTICNFSGRNGTFSESLVYFAQKCNKDNILKETVPHLIRKNLGQFF